MGSDTLYSVDMANIEKKRPVRQQKNLPGTRGAATACAVLGMLSFCCLLGPLTALPGIFFGHLAQFRLCRYGGVPSERRSVRIGLLSGYVGLVFSIAVWAFGISRSQSPLAEDIREFVRDPVKIMQRSRRTPSTPNDNFVSQDPRWRTIPTERLVRYLADMTSTRRALVVRPCDFGAPMPDVAIKIDAVKAGLGEEGVIMNVFAPETPERVKLQIEERRKHYMEITGETKVPPSQVMGVVPIEAMSAKHFDTVAARIPGEADIVLFLGDFPDDMAEMALWQRHSLPKIGAVCSMTQPGMKRLLQEAKLGA